MNSKEGGLPLVITTPHKRVRKRLSRGYRLRAYPPSELLGVRSNDWDPTDARWRHFLRPAEMPWITQHVVNGTTVYPGTDGYTLRDVEIIAPIHISTASTDSIPEVQTCLRQKASAGKESQTFEFTIKTYSGNTWQVNSRGFVTVHYQDSTGCESWERKKLLSHRQSTASALSQSMLTCNKDVDSSQMYRFLKHHGYDYGPNFQSRNQRCDPAAKRAAAEVNLFEGLEEPHVIHPTSFDTILQVAFTALTTGGSTPMATSVPSHTDTLWISNKGLSRPDTSSVTAYSAIESVTRNDFVYTSAALDSRSGEVRLWGEGIQLTNITSAPVPFTLPNPAQFCMHVDVKPDVSKLSSSEIMAYLNELHPYHEDPSMGDNHALKQIASYIDLLAHQKPGLNILEVAREGISATTRSLVSALAGRSSSSLRCNRYDFVTASAGVLESTRQEISQFHVQFEARLLDISQEMTEKVVEENRYDVVVVDVTSYRGIKLSNILRNARESLKLGAKLILRKVGDIFSETPSLLDITEASTMLNNNEIAHNDNKLIIFLADYVSANSPPFLSAIDNEKWTNLQTILQGSRRMLWVSSGGGRSSHPAHGMADGLTRTLRSEYYELHLVTLALDASVKSDIHQASVIANVAREMLAREPHQPCEQEYIQVQSRLHTRRLIEADSMKKQMEARLVPYQTVKTRIDGTTRFEASLESTSSPTSHGTVQLVESTHDDSELSPDQVEVEVRAVSLGERDRAILLGHREQKDCKLGGYCSGVIFRAGRGAELMFRPGDHVVATCRGSLRSHVRVPVEAVAKIPPHVGFTSACLEIRSSVAVYQAFVESAHVMSHETVLVYEGGSPIGMAAIKLLVDFPAGWFENRGPGMSRLAFDVVLAPSTSARRVFLPNMKHGGRYVVLGSVEQDIGVLPAGVSMTALPVDQAASSGALRYAAGKLPYLNPSEKEDLVLSAPDMNKALARLCQSDGYGNVVVTFDHNDLVEIKRPTVLPSKLDPDASYLIAGGLGGLGRTLARWLASRGAKHLILLSRSGPHTPEAQLLLSDLHSLGVQTSTPICDITDLANLRATLISLQSSMPPIKGCIQASMVMTELIFPKITYPSWHSTTSPKTTGSWNLHSLLPQDLTFFTMISSVMGILGGVSLAAYNAGNTYQDALARYRVSKGQPAIAIDLGAVPDAGYLAEQQHNVWDFSDEDSIAKHNGGLHALTYTKELCALLDVYLDPDYTQLSRDETTCQTVIGLRPVSHWASMATGEEIPHTLCQPFWGHMHHVPLPLGLQNTTVGNKTSASSGGKSVMQRVEAAGTLAEAAEIASEALAGRVGVLLGFDSGRERLEEAEKPMHSYGIDSLSAIEIRNWVGKVFDVDLPVFEILGGATFAGAGMAIVRKMRSRKGVGRGE
ncbi:KR domain-containing protein [Triangularia verruculosa]|uniref:KR domain-containing protein n=1 Tax=Triangularia verruculosa TaxID=2587418 RepID=A0AAN7AQT8_9PEZI|nr:KR domain-containing protein [Triangularia verruculosa]